MIDLIKKYCIPSGVWSAIAVMPLLSFIMVGQASAQGLDRISGKVSVQPRNVARGLSQPAGMAVHPITKEIYVAEKGAGRVSVIKGSSAVDALPADWMVAMYVPQWAIRPDKDYEHWTENKLYSPAGIAFNATGDLYVCESRPNGRILKFERDVMGQYSSAQVVPVPWLYKPYAWKAIAVDDDDQLYVAGAVEAQENELTFGSVLARDTSTNWWVVDYGPFADFSGIYLSADENIMTVSSKKQGAVTWWDMPRHMLLGMYQETFTEGEGGPVSFAPDGAILLARHTGSGSTIVRADPMSENYTDYIQGFQKIGGLLSVPEEHKLYVSEEESGSIIELQFDTKMKANQYLLSRSVDAFEFGEGNAPKAAPEFLANFFTKVGFTLTNDMQRREEGVQMEMLSTFTLSEFAKNVPLIAAQIQCAPRDVQKYQDVDYVTTVEFLLLFPSAALREGDNATPSMSFFSATYKSGKVARTKLLYDDFISAFVRDGALDKKSKSAKLYVPIAACGMSSNDDGMNINVSFLGLGVYDDFYIRLESGKQNRGSMVVENSMTTQRINYGLQFTKELQDGAVVRNLVAAGFDPRQTESIGWLKLGQWPAGLGLSTGDTELEPFASGREDITDIIKLKDMEYRLQQGEGSGTNLEEQIFNY